MTIEQIKQRFEIIGASPLLDRAINIAMQVAPTDLVILITGESGTGKEVFPKIIHTLSIRKHGKYFAVNCGAIPEGTIDSELFGHEKGSFTGAHEARKGYFEEANGGTIFLDEVSELPLQTQVRLLRVLESGEFIKVGSSKVQKTNVRIVAATNIDINVAIQKGKFREDLYYRLNTVPIRIPNLRERKEDIHLFFRKFATDFAEKYRMPAIKLEPEAQEVLIKYRWPGNVRQIKNITEQISVIEKNRNISAETLLKYLPDHSVSNLPVLFKDKSRHDDLSDREILYKVLIEMKRDIDHIKVMFRSIIQSRDKRKGSQQDVIALMKKFYHEKELFDEDFQLTEPQYAQNIPSYTETLPDQNMPSDEQKPEQVVEESLSLHKKEKELIIKALEKHKSNKAAAEELGISERTLYRKIKEYNIK